MGKRILCYGDSNTWGYMPGSGKRYGKDIRWTGRLQSLLGYEYEVLEAGLNGRTTVFDDPTDPYHNGLKGLGYQLITAKPIDLFVLFLGLNDMNFASANASAKGIETILYNIVNANIIYKGSSPIFAGEAKILVIAPPPYNNKLDVFRPSARAVGKYSESAKLSHLYETIAKNYNCWFINAGAIITIPETDCIHFSQENHFMLSEEVYRVITKIFKTGAMK